MTEVHSSCRLFTRSTGIENQWQINGKSMATIRSPLIVYLIRAFLTLSLLMGLVKPLTRSQFFASLTSLLQPPCGSQIDQATSLLQPHLYYSNLSITATSLLQQPLYYSHLSIIATLWVPKRVQIIRPPLLQPPCEIHNWATSLFGPVCSPLIMRCSLSGDPTALAVVRRCTLNPEL